MPVRLSVGCEERTPQASIVVLAVVIVLRLRGLLALRLKVP